MIGVLTFIIAFIVLGTALGIFKSSTYLGEKDKYGDRDNKPLGIVKLVVVLFASIMIGLFMPLSIERVDSGHVAILVENTGNERGMSRVEYKRGWVLFNNFTQRYYEFPVYQQHIDYEENTIITKGGFQVTIKPSFNYSLNPTKVDDMFQNLRVDIKQVEQGWLKNAIISSVNDVANLYTVDSIFNHRAEFESDIVRECNKRVIKWFNVSQLRTNIAPPKEIAQAIVAKTKAVQDAQAAIQRKSVAEAEAQEKIARAKGDSAQAVIAASGEAAAYQLKQKSLTPMLLQQQWIEKWNGALPSTQLSSGANTMYGLK